MISPDLYNLSVIKVMLNRFFGFSGHYKHINNNKLVRLLINLPRFGGYMSRTMVGDYTFQIWKDVKGYIDKVEIQQRFADHSSKPWTFEPAGYYEKEIADYHEAILDVDVTDGKNRLSNPEQRKLMGPDGVALRGSRLVRSANRINEGLTRIDRKDQRGID